MSLPTGAPAGSRRFWVVVCLFALANLAAWMVYDHIARPRADLLRVDHFSPDSGSTIAPNATFVWRFNLDVMDTTDRDVPGAFTPAVTGKWRWQDARTLTFTPSANLPNATRFSVALSPERLHSIQGFHLSKPFVSTLQTAPLSLVSATQIGFEGDDRAIIELQFSDNVLPSDVMKSLSITGPDGKPLPCELHGQAEGNIVRIVTESIPMLRQSQSTLSLNVRLAAGLAGTSGPLGFDTMVERSVPISQALFATELTADAPSRGDISLRLRFNGNITADILRPMLAVEPKIPFQLEPEYDGIELVGKFQPATRYAITIAKPSANSDPQKYPRGDTLSVFVPDCPPSLWFEHDTGYLGSRGNRTLLAHAINVSDIRISVTRVYDNNLVAWRNADKSSEEMGTDAFAHPIATKKIHLTGKKNQTDDLRIALDDLLRVDASKDGVYRVQIAADDPKKAQSSDSEEDADDENAENSASAVVTLSDIGLSAKQTREGITIWAVSLANAQPIANVRVRAFSDKNQLLGSAITDANGLATIAPIYPAPGENCAVIIADRASADLTWLDLRNSQLSFGDSDTTGQAYLRTGHEAFLFTDRGVYRPGETVHLRAIVRGPDNSTPPPFPIRWNILRPDLREWNSTITKLDPDGAASWDLALPDDLTTGKWTARIGLPGDEKLFGSVTFQVQEFLPDRLKASVKIGHADQNDTLPRLHLADKSAAVIQGDWLFGKPAAGLQTHVVTRMDPVLFAPPSWNDWTFGDTADTASTLGESKPLGHRNEIDTALLDDHGTAQAPLDLAAMLANAIDEPVQSRLLRRYKKPILVSPTTQLSASSYTGPWQLTISASVLEPGGRAVTAACQANVDVVDRYLAIQQPDLPPKPGQTTLIPIALVAPDGSSSTSDATLDATLYRESWDTTLIYKDGHYHYDSTRKLDAVGQPIHATISKGRGAIALSPPSNGEYVLRVRDGHDGAITSIAFIATVGGWDDNISREDPEKLELSILPAPSLQDVWRTTEPVMTKNLQPLLGESIVATTQPRAVAHKTTPDEFPVDSVVQVLVRSPFTGRLLLSVETDDILSTQVIDMTRSQMLVPIAMTGACRPNAFVTATVVRAIDPNAAWRVHRAVGVTRLKVDNTDRRLNIAITAPPEVRPNQSLGVRLLVTDSTSKPIANAAIIVAAVDEGICQLTNFATPDPFSFFYAPRTLGVTSADLYSDLMPEVARPDKTSAVGGDGSAENEGRHRTPVSAKRVRPVALVSGMVHTDQNGFAQTDFALPQFIGKLRVMAIAHAADKFGGADSNVLVRSPLLVQTSWPRFVAPGDSFSVTLTAFNNTSQAGFTKIAAQVLDDPPRLSFDANGQRQIELSPSMISPNGQSTQTLHVIADKSSGIAHARIVASLGSETFEETVEIPIRPASPAITTGGYAIATPDSPLPISLPKEMLPGTLSYQLRVTPRPSLQLPEGLDYLERYPYGCAEQTTSTLFPLVYLNDIGAQISPGVFTKERIDEKIRAGVTHLLGMQTADGGISMWPGEPKPWPWASVYVAHFVVEARSAGHPIPEDFRAHLLTYVHGLLNKSSDDADELETQAYATYVLALAGKPDRAAMDRLGDILSKPKADCPQARFHLAAAWMATGRRDRAAGLIPTRLPPMRTSRQLTGNLASGVRERAILLSTLLMVDPDRADLPAIAQQLADAGKNGQWRSTQDTAFAVMALGRYLRQEKPATPYDSAELRAGDTLLATSNNSESKTLEWTAPTTQPTPQPAANVPPELHITGSPGAKAYVSWLATGVPTTAPADTDNGLKIRRKYLNEQGKPIDHNTVHSGDLVQVELSLESNTALENIVIEDLLPAGLEIENPRLETTSKDTTVATPDTTPIFQPARTDMRDDRMIVIGDLSRGLGKYIYTCRAVTPGTFALPPTRAECMYDLGTNSISGAGTFTVTGNDALPLANTGHD